jgi:hypothetical protein
LALNARERVVGAFNHRDHFTVADPAGDASNEGPAPTA